MAAPLFQIPGNLKQQFIPFVLNPESELNKGAGYGKSADFDKKGITSPQVFSYHDYAHDAFKSGCAKLRFFPSSITSIDISDDISYKLLYEIDNRIDAVQRSSITLDTLLSHLPGVQIREFLPDTRLDQCINFFTDLFSTMTSMVTKKSDTSGGKQADKDEMAGFWKKLMECSSFVIKYLTGISDPNFYTDLSLSENINLPFSSYDKQMWKKPQAFGSPQHSPGFYVMTFPYTLYYRLQSCITSNIYEIPAATEPRRIASSDGGMSGWTDGGSDFMSAGGLRVSNILNKIPLIGNIASMILGNIGINYMPWWNADSGSKTKEPQIDIKFDLFNDNEEAAMMNFIFVNTLIPGNKWVQYNMFQHSSNLYDVKLEGINRLYACAGSFNVTYEGVLRDPPRKWINELVKAHANKNIVNDAFIANIVDNKIIKIPDVYRIEMHFQSILPANFNNFIFNFAENANHIKNYSDHVYDPTLGAAFGEALAKFGGRVADVWDKGDENAGLATKFETQTNADGSKTIKKIKS